MVSGSEHVRPVLESVGRGGEWISVAPGPEHVPMRCLLYLSFSTHARHVIRCGWRPLPSAPVEEIASEARELLQLVASACDTFFYTVFLH